jgi:hypothetical protein
MPGLGPIESLTKSWLSSPFHFANPALHLLSAFGALNGDATKFVPSILFGEDSSNCDFCQFVVQSLRSRSCERNIEEEVSRHGCMLKFLHARRRPTFTFSLARMEEYEVKFLGNHHLSLTSSSEAFELRRHNEGIGKWLNWPLIRRWVYVKEEREQGQSSS